MRRNETGSFTDRPKLFYGWYIVGATWIMIFFSGSVAFSIFFKPMLVDFGWDRTTLSSVQSVALVFFTILSPFLGRLTDRFGPKAMMFVCVAAQVLSRLFNGAATNIWHLYLARFFYSISVVPIAQVLINRWFIAKRGTAQGIFGAGMPIGTIILTPISQHLILTWGWRMTMFFWAAVALVVTLPLAFIIKNNPEDKGCGPDGQPQDRTGATGPSPGHGDRVLEISVQVEGVASFSKALKDASFCFLSASHFLCGLGCGMMMTHIVAFATDVGYSDMVGASLVSVQGAFNLVGLLLTGPLSDRIARKHVLAITHFIRGLSFVIVVVFILQGSVSLGLLYVSMALFGFGWFTTSPLAAGLVGDLFKSSGMGTLLGIILSAHMLGMAVGAYIGGALFDLTESYYLMFLIQVPLEALAAIFVLLIRQKRTL